MEGEERSKTEHIEKHRTALKHRIRIREGKRPENGRGAKNKLVY